MNIQWEEIKRGRCLTEYRRKDYDEAIKGFGEFVVVSQFDPTPCHINDVPVERLTSQDKISFGEILYGVNPDGTLEKLKSIIDSSD